LGERGGNYMDLKHFLTVQSQKKTRNAYFKKSKICTDKLYQDIMLLQPRLPVKTILVYKTVKKINIYNKWDNNRFT